jgi:hypothetical protein
MTVPSPDVNVLYLIADSYAGLGDSALARADSLGVQVSFRREPLAERAGLVCVEPGHLAANPA